MTSTLHHDITPSFNHERQFDKDLQMIYTMMSMKQSMDADRLAQDKRDDDKKLGFMNFPSHVKQMIWNASALSPFDLPASSINFFVKQVDK